jgi:hypothetical protein
MATSFTSWVKQQPGDLGVLHGVAENVAEEARTRGFASMTFVRFASIAALIVLR